MAVEIGNANYNIYRGDYSPQYIEMFEGDENTQTPMDVSALFDDIAIQIRKSKSPDKGLIKSLRQSEGTISLSDTNRVSWDFTLTESEGIYWYDIRFKFKDIDRWVTYVEGNVIVTNNVTSV